MKKDVTDADVSAALLERVRQGIEREGWRVQVVGSGRALPESAQQWLREDCDFDDTSEVIVVVFDKSGKT